jgi:type VI secretion system secreted protein VgrG
VAAILIVGILSLGSGMFGRWINSAGEGGLLPVPLHSLGEADYGVDEITRPVPAIGLEIIQDLLGFEEPPETGGVPEIALITPGDPSPTPTPTLDFIGVVPRTATPTENNLDSATATPGPRQSATPFRTAQATPTPTWTNSPPDTPIPTSTPGRSATSTPMPTQVPPTATAPVPATSTPMPSQLPPPTNIPNPSPTPPQVTSDAPRPTRSSTQVITPAAHYTPAVTAETPSLP